MNELQNAATGGKNQDRTRNSVLRQMALLQSMSLEQLREKWLDLYGEEPPSTNNSSSSGWPIASRSFSQQAVRAGQGPSQQAAKEDPVAAVNRRIPEERKSDEAILPDELVQVGRPAIWGDRPCR